MIVCGWVLFGQFRERLSAVSRQVWGIRKSDQETRALEAQPTPGLHFNIILLYKVTLAGLETCPSVSSPGRWRELVFVEVL